MPKELYLYEINASEIKQLKKQEKLKNANISKGNCFWVGSVNLYDTERLGKYLSLIDQNDIEKLSVFGDLEKDLIYSILVTKNTCCNEYYLITMQLSEGVFLPEVISIREIKNIKIYGIESKEIHLNYMPRNFFLNIIKNLFTW